MTRQQEFLSTYFDQIESIATYARATNFDINSGDFDLLLRNWLKHGKDFCVWVEDNKDEAIRATKQAFIYC